MTRVTQFGEDGTHVDLPSGLVAFVSELQEDNPDAVVLCSICEWDSGAIAYHVEVETVESITGMSTPVS